MGCCVGCCVGCVGCCVGCVGCCVGCFPGAVFSCEPTVRPQDVLLSMVYFEGAEDGKSHALLGRYHRQGNLPQSGARFDSELSPVVGYWSRALTLPEARPVEIGMDRIQERGQERGSVHMDNLVCAESFPLHRCRMGNSLSPLGA